MAAGTNWGYAGAQALPALTSLLTMGSTISDIEAKSDAAIEGMERAYETSAHQANILDQQRDEIDRELGDSMSARGLQAMQAEATLRAGAAETGTTGGTTDQVIKNVYMNQALDNAVLISRARNEKATVERRKIMNNVSLTNKLTEIKGGMATSLSAGLQTASSGMQGFSQGYNMLPNYRRSEFFT